MQIPAVPTVTFDEVMSHFKTQAECARAFDVSRTTLTAWKKAGKVPRLRALQFASLLDGQCGEVDAQSNSASA